MKLSHNLSYSFWQVLVATSALASLQRKREISNEAAGSPGSNEKCLELNIADRVLKHGCVIAHEEVEEDHDDNLHNFLLRMQQVLLKLNPAE